MRLSPDEAGRLLAANIAVNPTFDPTPVNVVQRAVDRVRGSYPELMACLDEADWSNRVASFCRLNIPAEHARAVTTDVFTAEGWLETALLHLIDTGVIRLIVATAESAEDIQRLRKSVAFHGLMPKEETADEPAAASTEPTGPTEEELDQVVIADWTQLCSADIRSKCHSDADYRARFDRLMTAGKLGR